MRPRPLEITGPKEDVADPIEAIRHRALAVVAVRINLHGGTSMFQSLVIIVESGWPGLALMADMATTAMGVGEIAQCLRIPGYCHDGRLGNFQGLPGVF